MSVDIFNDSELTPNVSFMYETDEIDMGYDAPFVASATVDQKTTASSDQTSLARFSILIATKVSGGTFTQFQTFTQQTTIARHFKFLVDGSLIPVSGPDAVKVLRRLTVNIQAERRTETGTLTIPGTGGTAVSFGTRFFTAPTVIAIVRSGSTGIFATTGDITATGFTVRAFDLSSSVEVSGEIIDWTATGV